MIISTLEVQEVYVDIIRDQERLRWSDATSVVWDEARTWEQALDALAHAN